ncbi:MAG: hypothetical protein AAGJ18_01455, partial [Bacteroidota bacterium]
MKITHLIITFFCLMSWEIRAQIKTLPSILTELGTHYKVFFSYDLEQIKTKKVTFTIQTEETVDQAVKRLLDKVELAYERFDEKYYVIYNQAKLEPTDTTSQKMKITPLEEEKKINRQTLTSYLVDGKEDIPISDAFIFIRNTSISTVSDLTGRFELALDDFTNGELVITHLNYQTLTIALSEVKSLPTTIRLSPKDLTFAAVSVKSKRGKSKKRKQWLKQFKKAFFGEGSYGRKMQLLNPEVVWFQEQNGQLIAEAVDYLSIYNGALGYKMRFYLEEFRTNANNQTAYAGKVYFEDQIKDVLQKRKVKAARMQRRRKLTYQRSKQVFFSGLLSKDLDSEKFPFGQAYLNDNLFVEGFTSWTYDSLNIGRGLQQDTLFIDGYFGFANKNIVTRWASSSLMNDYASAFLKPKFGRIIIDHSGDILNSDEIEEVGFWTTHRLANLLPKEYYYTPPRKMEISPDRVISSLTGNTKMRPQEKVYLHLNKPYYSLTESIWFKAYLLNAHSLTANTLSKVVYVDLIGPNGQIEKTWTLHTDKVMDGDFRFNNKHTSGEYTLRAYTEYMRNESPDYSFTKSFWVYDYSLEKNLEILDEKAERLDSQLTVQADFFPEGGDLIEGLESNVAFKVSNERNQPLDVVGEIRDQDDRLVTKIKTNHEGLGLFNLIPKAGRLYKAIFTKDKTSYTFSLPSVKQEGAVLRVNNRNADKIFIELQMTTSELAEGVFLVGHVQGQIFCFVEDIDTDTPIVFTKSSIPTGIAHFTLFNAENQPLAERLIFNEVGLETAILDVQPTQKAVQPREKITLDLANLAIEKDWKKADLSMTVTDKSVVKWPAFADNIQSYLLLNSDLKTPIPNINFYLKDINPSKRFWLDLWMMTYGWRRFVWQDLEKKLIKPLAFVPETG